MIKFLIGRGHDGPARIGKLQRDGSVVSIPALLSQERGESQRPYYVVVESESHRIWEPIHSMKSLLFLREDNWMDDELFLMPSIPAIGALGSDVAELVLARQYELLVDKEKTTRNNAIIRIPYSIRPERIGRIMDDFNRIGVNKAAFTFDGTLGQRDMSNIVLRSKVPPNWLIIALGRIDVHMIPILYYLGFDIFDIGRAHEAASDGIRVWENSVESMLDSKYHRFCSCSTCSKIDNFDNLTRDELTEALLQHNIKRYCEVLSESQIAMRNGRLRWLVETSTHATPALAAFIRQANKILFDFLEEYTPTSYQKELPLIGPESYNSPAVKRFRDRVAKRYSPPKHKSAVLLLPCSARKPYSESRSHKRFISSIERAIGSARSSLAEIILTSPLGVVPRELERVFPAANYDIPVTGDWDDEEISIGAKALWTILTKYPEDAPVIAHVSGGYYKIVKRAEGEMKQSIIYTTHDSSATSQDSLNTLSEVLKHIRDKGLLKSQKPTTISDTLSAVADFQFGSGARDLLVPKETRFKGKIYNMIMCFDQRAQTCSFLGSTGSIILTLEGGRRIRELGRYWVRFEGDRIRGSSIFAMGVNQADPEIRPGDEVIVLDQNDDVIAVGRSEMSGREMCMLDRGIAVALRHKRKGD